MADRITPTLPPLDMGNRARDAEGLISDAEMLISAITDDWTDFSENDPGVALVQWFSMIFDHERYGVERGVEDALIVRGSRRSAAVIGARLLGYQADGAVAASATLQFTSNVGVLAKDLTILKGTKVSATVETVTSTFETDVNVVMPAGSTVVSVGSTEGSTGSEELGISDGEAFQRFTLGTASIIKNRTQNTLTVVIGDDTWTEVSSTAQSKPSDRHYAVLRDRLDRLTLVFGDGRRGLVPPKSATIVANFRFGGGKMGNVPRGAIDTMVSPILLDGNPIALTVTNLVSGGGGLPRETLRSIRVAAPAFFASQGRVVSYEDYAAITGAVTGVQRAKATRTYFNHIEVRVVPVSWKGEDITADLRASVQISLDDKRMVTDIVSIRTADPVHPKISILVTALPKRRNDPLSTAVKAAIKTLYDPATAEFGGTDTAPRRLPISDMIGTVENVDGVDFVDTLEFTRRSLLLGILSSGWDTASGDATLGDITVGDTAKEEEWTIKFTSATTFELTGQSSGFQVATGVLDAIYSSDGGEISFTLATGGNAMSSGNSGRFRTSRPLSNIPYTSLEHPAYDESLDLTIQVVGGI